MIGTLDMAYLPRSVTRVQIIERKSVKGALDVASLPEKMRIFQLCKTSFSGTVDFTAFPQSLTMLILSNSLFSGSCDLTALPPALECFNIASNQFSGELCLTKLPNTISNFSIARNAFCGSFTLLNVPKASFISADKNRFTGVAVIAKALYDKSNLRANLQQNHLTAVVDEDGEPHGFEKKIMRIQRKKE